MGGGARPTGWSEILRRGCLVLCTAATTGFGAAALGAQTASAPATTAQPPAQSAHAAKPRPHRVARRDRGEDRGLAAISERINNNTVAIIAGGLGSTDL